MEPKYLFDNDDGFLKGFKVLLFLMVFEGDIGKMKKYYLEKTGKEEFFIIANLFYG